MTTKQQPPAKKPGKPAVSPEDRDEEVGQRDQTGAKPEGTKPEGTKPEGTKPEGTKPTVGPEKHDNEGERGPSVITNDREVE